MSEPWVRLGPLPPHPVFEALAYALGFALYRRERARRGDAIGEDTRWALVVAAAVGAVLGSKLLALLQAPGELAQAFRSPLAFLASGKTIVGGLLGGWIGVEVAKRRAGETRRTGDLFALPLAVGIAIGRIGCFLTGLADRTYGSPTSLPWGIDLGDGVRRHPAPLYEIAFLVALAIGLARLRGRLAPGGEFRLFLAAYLAFRFLADAFKPGERPLGLTAIQWAAILGLFALARDLGGRRRRAGEELPHG